MNDYRVWMTGLRRDQAKTRTGVQQRSMFTLPGGKQMSVSQRQVRRR